MLACLNSGKKLVELRFVRWATIAVFLHQRKQSQFQSQESFRLTQICWRFPRASKDLHRNIANEADITDVYKPIYKHVYNRLWPQNDLTRGPLWHPQDDDDNYLNTMRASERHRKIHFITRSLRPTSSFWDSYRYIIYPGAFCIVKGQTEPVRKLWRRIDSRRMKKYIAARRKWFFSRHQWKINSNEHFSRVVNIWGFSCPRNAPMEFYKSREFLSRALWQEQTQNGANDMILNIR